MLSDTQKDIERMCDRVKNLLLEKNEKYGDAALNPARILSKASRTEQLLVRIDDKLNRIMKGAGLLAVDEDVVQDLTGYFVLLMIALERDSLDTYIDAHKGSLLTEEDAKQILRGKDKQIEARAITRLGHTVDCTKTPDIN